MVESHCHIMSEDQHRYPRDLGSNPAAWVRDLPVEEFLKRIPEYRVVEPPTYVSGYLRSMRTLKLAW